MSGFTWKKRSAQSVAKRPRLAPFSVPDSDSDRRQALREQGVALAELDRFWEALRLWTKRCAGQTLGRALLGLGELGLARRAFSVAMRLQPDTELWREDLLWSCRLLERARRRRAQGGEMSDAGGVVSPAQTDEVRALAWT
ncbi:tetratricopeptide repeat protein 33-like [Pollicipes pollicipes]|uniref:tetratricopeptide repeat protein 33-like n=1 Tax=Pollicipes pollicipes TaxID=41117 RepID=UPI001884BFE5|nr:tetratricopeptide repeat protein 33-like [Pollicipes pollicipes]